MKCSCDVSFGVDVSFENEIEDLGELEMLETHQRNATCHIPFALGSGTSTLKPTCLRLADVQRSSKETTRHATTRSVLRRVGPANSDRSGDEDSSTSPVVLHCSVPWAGSKARVRLGEHQGHGCCIRALKGSKLLIHFEISPLLIHFEALMIF